MDADSFAPPLDGATCRKVFKQGETGRFVTKLKKILSYGSSGSDELVNVQNAPSHYTTNTTILSPL